MPPLSEATRPLVWNISHVWVMYLLFVVAVAIFAWGMYQRVRFWRQGKDDRERFADWAKRFSMIIREIFLQNKVRDSTFPAIFHSFIFYSFIAMFITTLIIMIQYDANHLLGLELNIFQGFVYVFFSIASEIGGVLVLIGLAMAAYRRYMVKPQTLPNTLSNGLVLLFLAGMIVTGYFVEGLRIAVNGDPWKEISPVGWGIASLFAGTSEEAGRTIHASLWWVHTVFVMSWIGMIPYTKFVHLLSLPTNIFFSKLKPRGELQRVDIEKVMESAESDDDFSIGIQKGEEFTWKQRLDMDTCVSCGRCDEVCPAYMADKEYFAPRPLIAGFKQSIYESSGRGDHKSQKSSNTAEAENAQNLDIIGNAFDEEYIWHCRTCSACMEVCPALIEHVDTLMEVRRNEVLIQGRIPAEATQALKVLETGGNPFGPQSDRVDWITNSDVRVVGPGEKVDVLYWIGCVTTFDPQKQKVAETIFQLMRKCGIDFGVLAGDENCCGDPARILGNEMLFQQIAKEQVDIFRQREFRVLLTSCPHCYNVFSHDYRQFGSQFEVVHHSKLLHEMIRLGKLKPQFGMDRKYVYHDSCYLGRYQNIYDSPREIIKAIPKSQLVEMKNHREKSLCCGGGGGHYWMDLKRGERINNIRVRQANDAGADTIVTGCMYCHHMLEDSIKLLNYDEKMRVTDLASLVMESLEEPKKQKAGTTAQ